MEEGAKGWCPPAQAALPAGSSQVSLIRGVRAVGELSGGVTGALIEPPCMKRWWGNLNDPDDDRFLSHGMRELGSALLMVLATLLMVLAA